MNSGYVLQVIPPQQISVEVQDVMTANPGWVRYACVELSELKAVACRDPEIFSSYNADPLFCLVAFSHT